MMLVTKTLERVGGNASIFKVLATWVCKHENLSPKHWTYTCTFHNYCISDHQWPLKNDRDLEKWLTGYESLLYKHEDLSLYPSTWIKLGLFAHRPLNVVLCPRDKRPLGLLFPSNSMVSERPSLKIVRRRVRKLLFSDLHVLVQTHVCMYYTPIYVHILTIYTYTHTKSRQFYVSVAPQLCG